MNISDLIVTKLNPPMVSRHAIERVRLRDKLQSAPVLNVKLILIRAPAGFGKTTLLTQWAVGQSHVCWCSLDKKDADARQFLKYFIASLHKENVIDGEEALSYLDNKVGDDYDDSIRIIINHIAAFGKPVRCILDDFHLVADGPVSGIILELLHYAPENFQLIIATRSGVELDLSNLRVQGLCVEIISDDLRFNLDEAKYLLNNQLSESINDLLVHELLEKTEGWVAGLQLALLSRPAQQTLSEFIQSFSGSVREVAQYLANNIFQNLDSETQRFLMATCILERFNAKVASHISGIKLSQDIIDNLEEAGLFITPLDASGNWYRYHQIFREFLLEQLQKQDETDSLYQGAYEWFLKEGLQEEAITYALEAGNIEDAISLVEALAMPLIRDGDLPRIYSWVKKIPDQYYANQPNILVYYCWSLTHMGLCKQTDYWLEHLGECLNNGNIVEDEREYYQTHYQSLKLANAVTADDIILAREQMFDIAMNEQQYAFCAGAVHNSNAAVYLAYNEFDNARKEVAVSRQYHQSCDSVLGQVYTHCIAALIEYEQACLYACQREVDHAENLMKMLGISDKSPTAALIKIPKAAVLYAWNQPDEARDLITRYLPLVENCSYIEIRNIAFITLSRILYQEGHAETALELLSRSLEVIRECSLERSKARIGCEKIKILLADDDLEQIHQQMRSIGVQPSQEPELPEVWERLKCLQIFVWCLYKVNLEPMSELIPVLAHMQKLAHDHGRYHRMLDIMLLNVHLLCQLQQTEQALSVLEESIVWTEKEDYFRIYLEQGTHIENLFRAMLKKKGLSLQKEKFVQRVLSAFDIKEQKKQMRSKPYLPHRYAMKQVNDDVLESLSVRELSIIKLLDQGLSNKAIGENLFIATNTVRWHVSNILSKLNVENRTHAVAVARQAGLLVENSG